MKKILILWQKLRARQQRRASMRHLLTKSDDHLLRDIGLTRHELHKLLDELED